MVKKTFSSFGNVRNDSPHKATSIRSFLKKIKKFFPVPVPCHLGQLIQSNTKSFFYIVIFQDIRGDIEFRHVKFAYPKQPNRFVLHDISLNIECGRTIAIVGPPDSGKGTLFNLLERFYLPNEGKIVCFDRFANFQVF